MPTLSLHSQEVIAKSGEVVFKEILSKFEGKNTEEYITFLENSGKIVNYDKHVLEIVASKMQHIDTTGVYSVNISGKTLHHFHEVANIISQHNVADRIIIEITERTTPDPETIKSFATAMNLLGVRIALDDFNKNAKGNSLLGLIQPEIVKLVIEENTAKCLNRLHSTHSIVIEGSSSSQARSIWNNYNSVWIQSYAFSSPSFFFSA